MRNTAVSEVLSTPDLLQLIASFGDRDPSATFQFLWTACGSANMNTCPASAWEAFTKDILGEDAPLPPIKENDTEEGRINALRDNLKGLLTRLQDYRNGRRKLGDGPEGDRNVKALVLAAVTNDGMALSSADPRFQRDRDIVLAALAKSTSPFRAGLVDHRLRSDRDFMLAAVTNNGLALYYAHPTLKADREIVLAAVTKNGRALGDADDTLQLDREIVLAAVTQNGLALRYADDTLKADPDIVLAALAENGLALQYADPTLQRDRAIVLAAVTQDGLALMWADKTLQADAEIVHVAVGTGGRRALLWAHPRLAQDPELMALASKH